MSETRYPFVSIAPETAQVIEGTEDLGYLIFTVTWSGVTGFPLLHPGTATYEIIPTGDNPVDANDFLGGVLPAGTLSFSYGEETRILSFALDTDRIEEKDETFTLELRLDDIQAPAEVTTARAEITVLDDDGANLSGPLVFRFFNTDTGVHLYTTDPEEIELIRKDLPQFTFEGSVFKSASDRDTNVVDVYRFYNTDAGTHFYTSNKSEARFVEENLQNFVLEDVAFLAYESSGTDRVPVYRYFNTETGAHFFTADEGERDIVDTLLDEYVNEGIAFYVDTLIS
ncbi:MAG: hypothetical protein GVY13_00135 [Alphaproteobacteria bacterium]|jgi:hypothetical protein|nr:hypothetical protein [Alphaproteobacteria bacterium]